MRITKTKQRKQPLNLTLSSEAIRQAEQLKKLMRRPSISNVVEVLIAEKSEAEKSAA